MGLYQISIYQFIRRLISIKQLLILSAMQFLVGRLSVLPKCTVKYHRIPIFIILITRRSGQEAAGLGRSIHLILSIHLITSLIIQSMLKTGLIWSQH